MPRQLGRVRALASGGIADARYADPRSPRQVLLAGLPAYARLSLPPNALRENLLLDVDTACLASGMLLRIGDSALLRLTFQCEACGSLDAHVPGLSRTIGAQRGMLARVLTHGAIHVGDAVVLEDARLPALPEDWRERVAQVIDAVPAGRAIGYADLARVAGIQPTYCRAFPRLLARLGPDYVKKAISARAAGGMRLWDGAGFYADSADP